MMINRSRFTFCRVALLGSIAALIMLASQSSLLAQALESDSSLSNSLGKLSPHPAVEEVVVTAEKRSSTVQRTPLSITALTGAELQRRGITTIDDALHDVAGVSLRSAGPGQTEIEMRGLSSSAGASPTVGFYLDDAPLTPPVYTGVGKVTVDPDLYDLSRVEVLRGPQGTLYGSGSMGGTVRLITSQPDLEKFFGSVDLDSSGTAGGNVPNGALNVAFNVPIVKDKMAIRIVFTDKYNSGWIDRIYENPFPMETNNGCSATGFVGCARGNVVNGHVVVDNKDVNWEHLQGGRVELLMKPIDDLKISTLVFYQGIQQGGADTYDVPPGSGGTEAHYQPANVKEPFFDKFSLFANTVSYDFDFAQLSAATSYWYRNESITQDFSETLQNVFFVPTYSTAPNQGLTEKDSTHQVSEEVRLTSNGSGRFNWIVGGFYYNQGSIYAANNISQSFCDLSVGGCAANPSGIIFLADYDAHVTEYAAFGEASYKITPALTATIGLRYFQFQDEQATSSAGLFAASGNAVPVVADIKTTSSGVTPKFNLAYEPSTDLTVYATAAEGFRQGGVNNPLPTSGAYNCLPSLEAIGYKNGSPTSYRPDTIWNYEVGEKAKFLGGRLSVNGDVYYIDWRGIQQLINPACGFPFTDNAGNAASYGPELEVSYRLTDNISIDGNATYTHASLTSVPSDSAFHVGEAILNIPLYTANASLVYTTDIWNNAALSARISNSLVGPSRDIAYNYENLHSYDIVSARLTLDRGPVSYAIYVNNLTNTRAQLTSNNTLMTDNSPSFFRMATNQPLTFGFNLKYKF